MKIIRRLLIFVILAIAVLSIVSFWLTSEASEKYPIHYKELIEKYAKENKLDPFLVAAVIRVESNYQPDARSHMNAYGLMQILPETGEWIAGRLGEEFEVNKLTDPEYNIRYGTYYLRYLMDYFGRTQLALAAYNGGLTNVNNWLNTPEYSKDGKTLDFIPFDETNNYVKKVTDYYENYQRVYHNQFPIKEIDSGNKLNFQGENFKNFLLESANKF